MRFGVVSHLLPHRLNALSLLLQVANSKGQSTLLIELLHPGADLIRNFDLQDLAAPGEERQAGLDQFALAVHTARPASDLAPS